jgi:hypothetical protein
MIQWLASTAFPFVQSLAKMAIQKGHSICISFSVCLWLDITLLGYVTFALFKRVEREEASK